MLARPLDAFEASGTNAREWHTRADCSVLAPALVAYGHTAIRHQRDEDSKREHHHNHHKKNHDNEDEYADYDLSDVSWRDVAFMLVFVSLLCFGFIKCLKAMRKKRQCPGCRKRKQEEMTIVNRNGNNIK